MTTKSKNVVTQLSGVVYKRDFFDDSIFSEWQDWFMNDDIVVSAHLKKRGIPMMVIPFPKGCKIKRLACMHIDPLYQENVKKQLNDEGLKKVYF